MGRVPQDRRAQIAQDRVRCQKGQQSRTAVPNAPVSPLWKGRVAVLASRGAPGMALAFCDRCPCSASLHPPQAALGFAAFDKILPKTAHSSRAPRTQFWAKFPCMCLHRRRMSADGDGSKKGQPPRPNGGCPPRRQNRGLRPAGASRCRFLYHSLIFLYQPKRGLPCAGPALACAGQNSRRKAVDSRARLRYNRGQRPIL